MRDLIRYANIALLEPGYARWRDSIPEIRIPCGGEAPLIDGIVTDACWSAARCWINSIRSGWLRRPSPGIRCAFCVTAAGFTRSRLTSRKIGATRRYMTNMISRFSADNVQVSFDPARTALFYQFLVNRANTRAGVPDD